MKERCSDCRGVEEDIYWTHFQSMHFCQFLPGDFHSQLMIPERFSEKMRGKLKKKLIIRGPSGSNWDVKLVETDDLLYFGGGWENFVDAHNLVEKDILMFTYKGNSEFDVLIFEGNSLCEKEKSYFVRKCGHTITQDDRILKEGSVEIIGGKSPKICVSTPVEYSRKGKETVVVDSEMGFAFDRNSRSKDTEIGLNKACSDEPKLRGQSPSEIWETVKLPVENAGKGKEKEKETVVVDCETTDALDQNSDSEDEEFSLEKTCSDEPELRGQQHPSQIWEAVNLPGSRRTPLRKGMTTTYNPNSASHKRHVTESAKVAVLKSASREASQSSFLVVMRPTHIYKKFFLRIPADWVTKNIAKEKQDVILRTKERSWKTRLSFSSIGYGGISYGWRRFVVDNRLEEFDVCVFKLAEQNRKPIVLDVSIFRVVPDEVALPSKNEAHDS